MKNKNKGLLLFFIVFMFPGFTGTAQKLKINKYDKFLKKQVKETTWFRLDVKFSELLAARLKKIDSNSYIELSMSFHGAFHVNEGNTAIFLLDDESTITLACVRGGVSDYNYNKYASYWNGKFLYAITQDELEQFQKHILKGVRTAMGDEYMEWAVKEKHAKMLQRAVELLN